MIGEIIKLLQSSDFKGVSQDVDIAKGKYKQPRTWAEFKNYLKRNRLWPLRK